MVLDYELKEELYRALSKVDAAKNPSRSPEGLVFATRNGGPLVSNNLRKRGLQSACVRAGLPRMT